MHRRLKETYKIIKGTVRLETFRQGGMSNTRCIDIRHEWKSSKDTGLYMRHLKQNTRSDRHLIGVEVEEGVGGSDGEGRGGSRCDSNV